MGKKILVSVDGSECSRKAFHYSLEEASKLDNHLTVLRVVSDFGFAGEVLEDALQDQIEKAEGSVRDLENEARNEGVDVDSKVLTGTDAATEIVKFADEEDYDLIVVGSRGRTELETITLGSVSEGIVNRANCPVLVVR